MGSEWVKARLGDVVELKRGYDLPKKNRQVGSVPIISSAGVSDFHSEAKIEGPGVITGRYGTIGEVFYCASDFWPLNTTLYVKDFKGNDERFVYYFLKTINYQQYSDKGAVPGVNRNHLYMAEVCIPKKTNTQSRIGGVLSALDNKIDLNRQMNTTLESMAQALFKSWFVDFDPVIDSALATGNPIPEPLHARAEARKALGDQRRPLPAAIQQQFPDRFVLTEEMGWVPEGWEVGKVSDLADLNPEAWTAKIRPEEVCYVDLSNTKDGRITDTDTYSFSDAPSRARRVLRPNDTIFGTVRPGNRSFAFIQELGLTGSTGFAVLRPRDSDYKCFIYYALTRKETIDRFAHLADGGAYPAIRPTVVSEYPLTIPTKAVLTLFDSTVGSWLKSIGRNDLENRKLADLRDTLLPKLLSGELRIPEGEQQIAEVL